MNTYLRNPLIHVWAFLSVITVVSWWISQGETIQLNANATVTVAVFIMAAVKVQLVVRYFMEVQTAPRWLKRTTDGWLVVLLLLLLAAYGLTH